LRKKKSALSYSNLPCASSPLLSLLIGVAVALSLLLALGTLLAVCGQARAGAGAQKNRAAPLPPCRPPLPCPHRLCALCATRVLRPRPAQATLPSHPSLFRRACLLPPFSSQLVLCRSLFRALSPPWPPCQFPRPPLAPMPPRLLVPRNHHQQPPRTRSYLYNPTLTSLCHRGTLPPCHSTAEPLARVARPSRAATGRAAATLKLASPPRRSTNPKIATGESSPAGTEPPNSSSVLIHNQGFRAAIRTKARA